MMDISTATFPENAFVQIQDESVTFMPIGATENVTIDMKAKAIQDEMGEAYDAEYGRMAVLFGQQVTTTLPQAQTLILYGYTDPVTEVIAPDIYGTQIGQLSDGTQIWKIVHNGVDVHPVHWHMFEVQLINRVAWDNNIREPDANELGWKETIRVNPLQNTIVALRPVKPVVPFDIPNSVRLLDPTQPEGAVLNERAFSPNAQPITIVNHKVNFGWEFVWHCHILAHEENDMMRSMAVAFAPRAPSDLIANIQSGKIVLNWNDNSLGETGFVIQRASDPNFLNDLVAFEVEKNVTSYEDTTIQVDQSYYYRVVAINLVGDTWDYSVGNPTVQNFPTATVASAPTNVVGPPLAMTTLLSATAGAGGSSVTLQWTSVPSGWQTGFEVQRATDVAFTQGVRSYTVGASIMSSTDTNLIAPGQTYYYRVVAVSGPLTGTWSNVMSVAIPV
jgi:hypothetical protein